jgi:hypothetical protein
MVYGASLIHSTRACRAGIRSRHLPYQPLLKSTIPLSIYRKNLTTCRQRIANLR